MKTLTSVNIILLCFHIFVLWGVSATAGFGPHSWVNVPFFGGPLVAATSVGLALWRKASRPIQVVNVVVVAFYIFLWIQVLPQLSWHGWS